MKVRSAKKTRAKTRKSKRKSIFLRKNDKDAADVDLLDVEVISAPSNSNSSGRLNLSVSSLPAKLISQGFDKIEVVAEEKINEKIPAKASPEEIEKMIKKESSAKKSRRQKTIAIDLTKTIDKKKLPSLVKNSELEEDEDEEVEFKFVKSTNFKLKKQTIRSEHVSGKSEQTDRQGILELRLGKAGGNVSEQTIDEISSQKFDFATSILGTTNASSRERLDFSRKISDEVLDVPPVHPLLKLLKSKDRNSGNKKRPSLLKRSEIRNSISRASTSRIQKPLIKSIERKQSRKIVSDNIKVDLPGPKANLSIKITNRQTGRVFRKPIRPRRFPVIPFRTTYPYKSDLNIPQISIAYLSDSQTVVSLSGIHPSIKKLDVYRREISSRTHEDLYELIETVEDPQESYKFIDDIENARAFKYVCLADDLPLYSYGVYRNRGFKFENMQEPFIYAFQSRGRVLIIAERLPTFCRKMLVYRKSSAEDVEVLVDAVSLYGRGTRRLRLVDSPIPIEQTITYRFVWIDENGIENSFEERPTVTYTARLGDEQANITKMQVSFNRETNEVDIAGEAVVDNMFITTSDSELKNPGEDTLKAASRGQNIIKLQIRRINLKTGDDEVIFKEIVNPGLSKFNTELNALNRLTFSFSDSGENALTFGYTPLFDNTSYAYIGRMIVYPLGLELSKVSDFGTIEGDRQPGRLPYNFDPAIFDHPLNTELGILPASANQNSYLEADVIGATSRAIYRRIKVLESDINDSISLEAQIYSDSVFDPVVKLVGKLPRGLIDDIDHIAIEMSYDTVKDKDIIDRLFLLDESFEYYDYSFDDLACNSISYTLIGIAKDFKEMFRSEPAIISMKDPKLKLIEMRRKSFQDLKALRYKESLKARLRERTPRLGQSTQGDTDG